MKYIKGFEGLYSVTKCGRVFSHCKGIFRSLTLNKHNGYMYVTFKVKGVSKTRSIHRLVAEAYIDNTENKPEVDHIDCDKTNNNILNLRWATRSEQLSYSYKNGNRDEYLKKISKVVVNRVTGEKFPSQKLLSEHLGINYETVKWRTQNNKWEWETNKVR